LRESFSALGQLIAKSDLKNLGAHTEMLCDAFVDMADAGVLNGRKKQLDPGRIVYTFALGTQKLYDFIDNNPAVAGYIAKKVFGAKQVIAVDILQNRVDMALNQGIADLGFNPNTDEVVKKIQEATGGLGVDVVLETPGLEETMAMSVAATRPSGIVSTIAVFSEPLVRMPLLDMILRNIQLKMGIQKSQGLEEMLEWIKEGKIDTKFMLTHRASLNDLEKGYKIFGDHEDGCVKWLITPYERLNI